MKLFGSAAFKTKKEQSNAMDSLSTLSLLYHFETSTAKAPSGNEVTLIATLDYPFICRLCLYWKCSRIHCIQRILW